MLVIHLGLDIGTSALFVSAGSLFKEKVHARERGIAKGPTVGDDKEMLKLVDVVVLRRE